MGGVLDPHPKKFVEGGGFRPTQVAFQVSTMLLLTGVSRLVDGYGIDDEWIPIENAG